MASLNDTIRLMPIVLERLRRRAGHATQASAIRAIRKATGVRLTAARFSLWESGQALPTLRSLLTVLAGLGYDLKNLQDEIDHLASDPGAPARLAKKAKPRLSADERDARQLREIEEARRALKR